ncbi:PAS domain-containing protein [Fimbriiglobus ruber]|nr:PAS domain-containing protein [Fimbriiglobus ruber]
MTKLSDANDGQRHDEALRRSEERYRALVEATSQAVWSWSPEGANGDYAQTQQWWEKITGQTVEEQSQSHTGWLDVVHPEDREAAAIAWSSALSSGIKYDIEYRVRERDKGWRHIHARGVPIRNPDGSVREWIGTLDDVTDRRRAEAEHQRLLREVEAERGRLADVFQHAPSFTCVLRGPTHVFERANERYFELVGHRDIIGKAVRDAFPEVEGQGFFEILDQVYRTGESFVGTDARIQIRIDGILQERFLDFVYQPLWGVDATVSGIIVQGIDLTERRRAKESLSRVTAESERQRRMFETTLSNTADFVYLFDLDGRFTYVNKALLDLWRKELSQAVGRTFFELDYPHELASRLQRQIREVIDTRQPLRDETPYTSADGTRAYEYIFVPVFGSDGSVEAVAGSTRDITDRRQVEIELRDIRSRMEAALAASAIGTWAWDVPADRFHADASLARLFSLKPEDISGAPLSRIVDSIHPDDRDRVVALVTQVIEDGSHYEADYRVVQPDGSWRWVNARGQVERDEAGRALRFPGVVIDVTERKHAEADLRKQTERMRLLWEAAAVLLTTEEPDAMMRGLFAKVAPHFGLDTYFNFMVDDAQEALRLESCFGIPAQTVDSIRRLEFGQAVCGAVAMSREPITAAHIQQSDDPRVQLVKGFGIRSYTCNPLLAGNHLLGTLSFASRTRDAFDPDAEEFLRTICRYVTVAYERLRLVRELRDSDRKKDDFIALLAHELRNPLAPIRNGLQVVRLSEDRGVRERSQAMMARQLTHMVRLIDDLLDVSRISRNKMELRRGRIPLADVISSAVETARPAVDEAEHKLAVSLPAHPVFLNADLTRLSQVFSNLLTNSAKYTQRGGEIWLSAQTSEGVIIVSVRDNGIGIPRESLPHIFDMFSQVDRSIERSTGGLGIGLALVKGLVEMHDGTVTARSEGPGLGSEFIVTLPVHGAKLEAAVPEVEGSPPAAVVKRRILVVDDNSDGAESLAMMLDLIGNEVAKAHDGIEAVDRAERFRPEIILMDVGMPQLNGLDATKRIREQPWGRGVIIIALTGWGQESDRERTREAGCDGHLVKPVSLPDLERLLAGMNR